jgi:hypothetical protein
MAEAIPRRIRNRAFILWCENKRNMSKVRDILLEQYTVHVTVSTILRWRDTDDWEAKLLLKENQFKRLLRSSDDPILREMAMDDAVVMKFLGIMTRLITEQLHRRSTRQLFQPRNAKELMQMMSFIIDNQQRILGVQQEKEAIGPRTTNINIDNRKLVLRERLGAVPVAHRRMIIDQMRGATMTQKELAPVREEVWDDASDAAG